MFKYYFSLLFIISSISLLAMKENENPEEQVYSVKDLFDMGYKYLKGLGVEQNYEQALKWHLAAAKQNHLNAQYYLGYMYQNGLGVDTDYEEAMKWYLKAAAQNHPIAQNNIGYMYRNGLGVEKNYEKCMEWYLKAANQNYAIAQFNIARMYELGICMKMALAWRRIMKKVWSGI